VAGPRHNVCRECLADTSPCIASLNTGKGLFTSTDPESRRVKPESVAGRVCVKVVYVVLEAQYQSAISAAVNSINSKNSKVRCEM
jgi:magnesium chelatase subunit H